MKNLKGINTIGLLIAFLSFLIGTIFFLMFYYNGLTKMTSFFYFFIISAGIINLGLLIILIIKSVLDKNNRKDYLRTSGIMILNIPIVILYCYFVIVLLDTMRIEFINETGKPISEIKIMGCEPKTIDELGLNEEETVWIGITGDCSINIEYTIDGEVRTENVEAYVTSGMGKKSKYRIGNQGF